MHSPAVVRTTTQTALDPGYLVDAALPQYDELGFFVDALRCVRDVLRVPLSGDVAIIGLSQGAKLAARFGCAAAARSRGELRVRAVVVAGAAWAAAEDVLAVPWWEEEPLQATPSSVSCEAALGSGVPPPLLLFQAANDVVVPYCTSGVALYRPDGAYLAAWALRYSGCAAALPLSPLVLARRPLLRAFCPVTPPAAADSSNGTDLLRIYTAAGAAAAGGGSSGSSSAGGCAAPVGMYWLSELQSSGHRWPGAMPAAGGQDGADVALAFFGRVAAAAAAGAPLSDDVFPWLGGESFSRCAAEGGTTPGWSADPCSDDAAAGSPPPPPPPSAWSF
jgi:hypothetical protein